MKKLRNLMVIVLYISLSGCSSDDRLGNSSPVFDLLSSTNAKQGVDTEPMLEWIAATDADGDKIVYDIYLDDEDGTTLVQSNIEGLFHKIDERLLPLHHYYWKVVAKDGKGAETASPIFEFITRDFNTIVDLGSVSGFSERVYHSAEYFKDNIYVLGGYNYDNNDYLGTTVLQSSNAQNWAFAEQLDAFSPRYVHASAVFNNKLWVFGGQDATGFKHDVWSSEDGIQWTKEKEHATFSERRNHKVIEFDGLLWLIGGEGQNMNNIVWNSEDGINWFPVNTNYGGATRSHVLLVFDGKLWSVGGYSLGDATQLWYTEDGYNWTQVSDPSLFSYRFDHSAIVFDNRIWVIGGSISGQNDQIYSSADGIHWELNQDASDDFQPGFFGFTAIPWDNSIYLIGGYAGSNSTTIKLLQ